MQAPENARCMDTKKIALLRQMGAFDLLCDFWEEGKIWATSSSESDELLLAVLRPACGRSSTAVIAAVRCMVAPC